MANQKKYKKLTRAEKETNKKVKEMLISEGILPPDKPKLNRKKFAKEVVEEYKEGINLYRDIRYLTEAISWMLPDTDAKGRDKISSEQVGVLKVLKLASEIKKFYEKKIADGEKEYKVVEYYETTIQPILKL